MNYLARLIVQTGLNGQQPVVPPPPAGIEIIDEEIEMTAPVMPPTDAPATLSVATQAAPNPAPPPEPFVPEVVERLAQGAPDPAPSMDAAQEEIDIHSPAQVESSLQMAPPTPPGDPQEVVLRQVMRWVASNEAPPRQGLGKVVEEAEVDPAPPSAARRPDVPEVMAPLRDIGPRSPEPVAEVEVRRDAVPAARSELRPARPSPPHDAPEPRRIDPAQTTVVEEKIEISIGTIHLDVTPKGPDRAVAPPPSPLPQPALPRAASSGSRSRLARRFIRV